MDNVVPIRPSEFRMYDLIDDTRRFVARTPDPAAIACRLWCALENFNGFDYQTEKTVEAKAACDVFCAFYDIGNRTYAGKMEDASCGPELFETVVELVSAWRKAIDRESDPVRLKLMKAVLDVVKGAPEDMEAMLKEA
jgi:hypothetical protein